MKLVIKFVVVLAVWGALSYFTNVVEPGLTRDVALNQFENSESSFTDYATWRQLLKYVSVLYVLPLLLFIPEVAGFIKKTKK